MSGAGTKGMHFTACLRDFVPSCLPRTAFTLVEIMLAVLVLALLASAAAMSFCRRCSI